MFSVWLEIYLVSVCSRCEGKSVMDFLATVKYRRPYAIAVVTDNIVCILASIWRGCRNFESCTQITAQWVGGLSASIVCNRVH